ncbi:hypothetical protein FB106_10198 [Synechococcus sp. Ace-Pa]|nr:hypothetical protein FB106_10198 [Synechococcus sp. Ace-Pa]
MPRLNFIRKAFLDDPELGLLAPPRSLVPSTVFLTENIENLVEIFEEWEMDA